MLFYCMDPRFYQKILQNYGFFFSKKVEIFENQNFNKIPSFTVFFLAFFVFCFLFHLSKLVQKLWNFL